MILLLIFMSFDSAIFMVSLGGSGGTGVPFGGFPCGTALDGLKMNLYP
jgi:hypothetical protein